MAFADKSVYDDEGDGSIIGCFREKTYGNFFEFSDNEDMGEWAGYAYPHKVWVTTPTPGGDCGYRYARVLKTIAYVVTDEDGFGEPVEEKWDIKNMAVYEGKSL